MSYYHDAFQVVSNVEMAIVTRSDGEADSLKPYGLCKEFACLSTRQASPPQ